MKDLVRVHINDFLVYIAEFGVVICRQCRHAIQPSALDSHLLRHRIYRHRRRALVERLNKLDLRHPDDVPVPNRAWQLPELPTQIGLRCDADGCRYLCATDKGMQMHWASRHSVHTKSNVRASTVALQTFFRGIKLRYFEVSTTPGSTPSVDTSIRAATIGGRELEAVRSSRQPIPPGLQLNSVDARAMMYLHHFTLHTAPTLVRKCQPLKLWQDEVPQLAFEYPFLLHALLGLSAYHISIKNPGTSQEHRHAAARYSSLGATEYAKHLLEPNYDNTTAILACANCLTVEQNSRLFSDPEDSNELEYVAFFLSGILTLPHALAHLLPRGSYFMQYVCETQAIVEEANHLLKNDKYNNTYLPKYIPPSKSRFLSSLPDEVARLSRHCPKILRQIQQGQFTLRALLYSIDRSYASDDLANLYDSAACWVRCLDEHAKQAIRDGEEFFLIMYACWCIAIHRIGQYAWFTHGIAEIQITVVRARLAPEYQVLTDTLLSLL
uniref:C2H2-type domain-containing protein n=1 Tax=Bionectria ochroleuca TaxID=29856 RepID=A0A8H7K9N3_BIOOC